MRKQKLKDNTFIYTHDKGEYISDYIEQTKWYYEPKTIDYIKSLNLENCTIIDVGANIGNHTHAIKKFTKDCLIFSFEPFDENFKILEMNTNIDKNIQCFNAFISNDYQYAFTKPFKIEPVWGKCNLGYIKKSDNGQLVKYSIILDSMIEYVDENLHNNEIIKLIKIDVEGLEINVLEGAKNILNMFKPIIIAEHHTEYEHLVVLNYLSDFGYTLETIIEEDNKNYVYKVI
jgi:FkbM family methyltransferase